MTRAVSVNASATGGRDREGAVGVARVVVAAVVEAFVNV